MFIIIINSVVIINECTPLINLKNVQNQKKNPNSLFIVLVHLALKLVHRHST